MKNVTIHQPKLTVICDGVTIGENSRVHPFVFIGKNVVIGVHCKIQAHAFIPSGVTIGDNVFIGPHVCFTNDKHPPSNHASWSETTVEDGVVIGAGAVICPGVTLGQHSTIAAGAVVTKDVPPNALAKGNPARFIDKLTHRRL